MISPGLFGRLGAVALLAGVSLPASASPVQDTSLMLSQQNMSLSAANQLATAAIAACRAIDRAAVVAVVDRGGNLIALQRGDSVGPHNTAAAQRKAFTALSTKTKTGVLAERAQNDPSSRNLNTVGDLLLLGGGVPVTLKGDVIGAVGVAGAGGASNDEDCAAKAVQDVFPDF